MKQCKCMQCWRNIAPKPEAQQFYKPTPVTHVFIPAAFYANSSCCSACWRHRPRPFQRFSNFVGRIFDGRQSNSKTPGVQSFSLLATNMEVDSTPSVWYSDQPWSFQGPMNAHIIGKDHPSCPKTSANAHLSACFKTAPELTVFGLSRSDAVLRQRGLY